MINGYSRENGLLTNHRNGVILVFVLLLLSIAGAICGQYASKVIRLNTHAALTEKELQQRWAILSLRRSLLSDANIIMALDKRSADQAPTSDRMVIRMNVRLNGQAYSLQLEDESAKLPLQRLLKEGRHESARPIIRELSNHREKLQSTLPKEANHWRQIFNFERPANPQASLSQLHQASSQLTLYSDGAINIRTCTSTTLDAAWKYKFGLSAPTAIHDLRKSPAFPDLRSIAAAANLSSNQSEFFQTWFATRSSTHSLWIDATDAEGSGFTATYYLRSVPGFADEHFGFHSP